MGLFYALYFESIQMFHFKFNWMFLFILNDEISLLFSKLILSLISWCSPLQFRLELNEYMILLENFALEIHRLFHGDKKITRLQSIFSMLDVGLCDNSCCTMVSTMETSIHFTNGNANLPVGFILPSECRHFSNTIGSVWLLCRLERSTFAYLLRKEFCHFFSFNL